ncbi:MAG: tRNA 2-thiouridine(34) synthase MnmA [spirochete symbiont of Stewartia floridana]|nr:MAG: tRNA 2-thiouridine(34) synthase MnmA [spirochete symbiont of Stewartia floridana]
MKIGVLLSGGVDSSTALVSLKKDRPDAAITAFYLKIWLEDELSDFGSCPWEEDMEYAAQVCRVVGVPLKVISLQREYRDRVVDYTITELRAGRTPSPDIFCNRRIKFGAFIERAGDSLDKIASGHYAVVSRDSDGLFRIRRSPDEVKDQTYFLSHLTQQQASLALFPVGMMTKKDVRRLAQDWDLPAKSRKDSQGICFLGKIKYPQFVRHYLGEKEGVIIDGETNHILGAHRGAWFYTIGQRTGLGLSGGPWYVIDRDVKKNIVFVGHAATAQEAAVSRFNVVRPNWIAGPPAFPARLSVKLRHGPRLIRTKVSLSSPSQEGLARLSVQMDEADRGVAPGQFAVFYQEDLCLGGAMIEG